MESDFDTTAQEESHTGTTRTSVLYDVGNVFECALAALIKCDACVAAVPRELSIDYEKLAERLVACDPHTILILGNKWKQEFYTTLIGEDRNEAMKRIVIVLTNTPQSSPNDHVVFASSKQFTVIAPILPVISAQMIFTYLMSHEQNGSDGMYFNIALRSQISIPYNAFTLVKSIITDWKRVMDAEEMVAMGRYISHIGTKIAKTRISKAILINDDSKRQIRVIECPDYVAITMSQSQEGDATPAVIYTLSPDTTTCSLTCSSKEIATFVAASNETSIAQIDDTSYFSATCATDDFFAIVRKCIITPAEAQPLDPGLSTAIEAGASVIEFCARQSGN